MTTRRIISKRVLWFSCLGFPFDVHNYHSASAKILTSPSRLKTIAKIIRVHCRRTILLVGYCCYFRPTDVNKHIKRIGTASHERTDLTLSNDRVSIFLYCLTACFDSVLCASAHTQFNADIIRPLLLQYRTEMRAELRAKVTLSPSCDSHKYLTNW